MISKQVLMGIDCGTGGVRVGLYDIDGKEIVFATTEYKTTHEHTGWAEQNPLDWWNCLAQSTRKAIEKSGVSKEEIVSLSLDATSCSVVLSMNDGTPLRNSLIWMDVRASEEADFITKSGDDALKVNGHSNVSAEWMPCKALWLKKHDTENYNKAQKVCEYADWLMYKLTGIWTANNCNTSVRWYYNPYEGGFPVSFYEKIGLADVLQKFPQEVKYMGDRIGTLTREAAQHLGMSEKTMVGQGGIDAHIGVIGLDVVRPGRTALITGSSHLIFGLTETAKYSKGIFGPAPDAIIKGLYVAEGGQTSSGSIVSWFKNNFCKDLGMQPEGAYTILDREAAKIAPGSDGLLVLDWWQGNRTPYTDPNVHGMIYGLSLLHTQAHIFRAIMEGVAYGTENVLQSFRTCGYPVDEIYMGGGTTSSELFMQIHADVSNIAINVPENPQSSCLGSAILAAVTAGFYPSIQEAADKMVRFNKRVEPNFENHKKYREIFKQYQKAYGELGNWMRETFLINK